MAAGLMYTRGSFYGLPEIIKKYDSNATIANGDTVVLKASQLEVGAAAETLLGVAIQAMTSSTVGGGVNCTPGLVVIMDSSSTGIVATDAGKYFDTTGGTNAQAIDISTRETTYNGAGTARAFVCTLVNPQGVNPVLDSDVSVGEFVIVKHQFIR